MASNGSKPVYKFTCTVEPKDRRLPLTEKEMDAIAEYLAKIFDLYGLETVTVYEKVEDGKAQ